MTVAGAPKPAVLATFRVKVRSLTIVRFAFETVRLTSRGSVRPVPISLIGSLEATGLTGSQRLRRFNAW